VEEGIARSMGGFLIFLDKFCWRFLWLKNVFQFYYFYWRLLFFCPDLLFICTWLRRNTEELIKLKFVLCFLLYRILKPRADSPIFKFQRPTRTRPGKRHFDNLKLYLNIQNMIWKLRLFFSTKNLSFNIQKKIFKNNLFWFRFWLF